MSALQSMSKRLLLQSYKEAVQLGLDEQFLGILLQEIRRRGIDLQIERNEQTNES
jgi:hypothetical protein